MSGRIYFIAACLAIAPTIYAQTSVTPFITAPNLPTPTAIRFGDPITVSGRVLPADATGSLTFLIDNVAAQTFPLSTRPQIDAVSLGDDIAYAGYIADPTQRYPALLAQSLGATATNLATIGATACDLMPLEILPNNVATTPATSPIYSVLVGTNDIASFGTGSHEAVFNLCHQAALVWLAIPRANKLLVGDPNVTIESGSWSPIAAPTSCCLTALNNSTGNGTLRFTLTTSTAAYLWYVIDPNTSGSFTVSVDGGPASSPIQTQQLTPVVTYGLLRLATFSGAHTFDVTAQSGTITILGMGTPSSTSAPIVLAADIPNQIGSNATAIAAYTADIETNIAQLRADGLDVRFVPSQQFMFATAAEMMDPTHPNSVGLAEIAQAFESVATPPASTITPAANFSTNTLPIGTHTVAITYSGDSRYPGAYTETSSISVYDGASTISLASDAPVYAVQSPITLTATIPQPNSTGQVVFSDESGPIGSAWLDKPTARQAQLILPGLPIGVHTVTAQYLGDITYNASASSPLTLTVSGTYTATSVTAPATRFFAKTPIPLTATVSPSTTTGTVTFSDGITPLAQAQLTAGNATVTTATLAPGIHTLTAAYGGSSSQDPSTSPALDIEIDLNSTDLSLLANPMTASFGTPIIVTAAIQPTSASGTITLLDGTRSLGQANLANGAATFTLANLKPGGHSLTASYNGDTNNLPSSAAISVQITLTPTTMSLLPATGTAEFGSPISFAAQVTPASATGTVTLLDGNTIFAVVPLSGGVANCIVSTLIPGTHSITAVYSGDAFDWPSTSPATTITITPTVSAITIAPLPASIYAGNAISLSVAITPSAATGTVLYRDATLGILGQSSVSHGASSLTVPGAVGSYSITAIYSGDNDDSPATSASAITQVILNPSTTTVIASPANGVVATPITLTASVTPPTVSGSVLFLDGATPLGNSLVTNGNASLTTTALSAGAHTLRATYSGDPINASSTSTPTPLTVSLAASATSITLAQNPVLASNQVILNIAVSSSASNPTGTASIRSGSTILTTGSLANGSNGFAYATLAFNASSLGLGTFPLTVSYSGDVDNLPSVASTTVTVAAIPTAIMLTPSSAQIPISGAITITASVAPNAAGTMTFLSNGAAINSTPAGQSASFTYRPTSIGTYSLIATFTPTGLYASSTSVAQILTVTPPLSATLTPTSVSAAPGTSTTATLMLTPLSGFTGPIQATCSAPVAFTTCTVAVPATLTTAIATPVQIKLSTSSAELSFPKSPGLITIALAFLVPCVTRRRLRRSLFPFATFFATLWLAGCAEGGDFNSLPPGPQIVTITITAANTPVTATLTVNVID